MYRTILSYSLVAALLTTSVSFNALADKEDTGALVGAIVGGIIGNQIGGGSGRDIATGVGVILGAVIGADIGKTLDESDRRALADAQRNAFRRPVGERTDWDGNQYGSRTGAHGNFRTTREGYLRTNSREICREYESIIITRQKTETKRGIACSRADGSWREVNSTEVVFRDGSSVRNETVTNGRNPGYNQPVRPIEPSRPYYPNRPNPGYPPPVPGYGYNSLRGFCQDFDHSQFLIAKQFATSYNGPYLSQTAATQWALNYNRSHRCGTISEFSARFQALKNLATAYNGLYISESEARIFAEEKADYLTTAEISEFASSISKLKSFITSYNGLYKNQQEANRISRNWIERNGCDTAPQIQIMWDQFVREYNFATSYNGLYMNSSEARNYALNKVARISRCSDLLR